MDVVLLAVARFRAPANVQLRRAQIILVLATLIPTILLIATGIVLLAVGSETPSLVAGVLVLAFCGTSLTGYILGSLFLRRGAQVARFQNDFLSSVSHELRTPLTSIGLFIETLRDERLTDPKSKNQCLTLLDQEVHRLQGLVERLLNLSKIEAGHHGFVREPVSVQQLIEVALSAFEASSILSPVEVAVDCEDELYVLGDSQALGQALSNLLVNAWKYSEKVAPISIVSVGSSKHVDILISDKGPGVPKAEQQQIFDEFARGRRAIDDKETRGSGLGLAIVQAIVRAHKGRIDLRNLSPHGAEFRIRLRRV